MKPFLVLCFFFLGICFGFADVSFEGKQISSIEIEILGPPTVGESYVKQNLQIEEKGNYSTTAIDKSIQNLMDTGSIKDVKVFVDPEISSKQKVALVFKITTKPRIEQIIFEGNDEISDKKLSKTITSQVGELFDESKLKADLILLEELYLEKGFWNSQVHYQITSALEDNAQIILKFELIENDSRKIRKIIFSGNQEIPDTELLDVMESAPWRFWRFWSKRSKYQPRVLEEDLEKVAQAYREKGFLDVQIKPSDILISPIGSTRIDLEIKLLEGSRSFFGKQTIMGNAVFDQQTLLLETLLNKENHTPRLYYPKRDPALKKCTETKVIWMLKYE